MSDDLDMAQAVEERQRDAAIARARGNAPAAGTGICVDCDQPIAPARLKAHPHASRCIGCQEAFEDGGR